MALVLTSPPPSLLYKKNTTILPFFLLRPTKSNSLSFSLLTKSHSFPESLRFYSTISKPHAVARDQNLSGESPPEDDGAPTGIVDKWGEKSELETEQTTKLPDVDPPRDEDEWEGVSLGWEEAGEVVNEWVGRGHPEIESPLKLPEADPSKDEDERGRIGVNGSARTMDSVVEDETASLKRSLVDTVYGTELGFRASAEVRAEVLELVSQLEAANPTPVPTKAADILDGNWVLVYTASSELLPLLAAGTTTPLLKVKSICQTINTSSLTIENSTTLSGPFATFSFSASAIFEVRTPTRIQVEFKEVTLQPPEIKSSISLPNKVDIFGQKIDLSPVQQSLNPLQEVVASIAGAISGQPPLKVPLPGEWTKSWLLITYLDKDLRISRGDGGLFVLAKEGSPLLDQ